MAGSRGPAPRSALGVLSVLEVVRMSSHFVGSSRRSVLPLFLIVLLVGGLSACGGGAPDSVDHPIVFVGFDSADWTWIDPALEAGRMPNFQALIDRGVRAPLESLQPPQKSPTIWTSIATGKRPAKHGVADFITHESKVQTSDLRQSATYWEILGQIGRRQAVLGWWITFPATPLNGVMVSDFLPYFQAETPGGEGAVYPPESWEAIRPLLLGADDVDEALLSRFVDLDLAREHGDDAQQLLAELESILAADLTYLAVTRHLVATDSFDVFTVYFRGLDMACHEYWRYFEPHYSGLDDDDWRVRLLGDVVPAYYEFIDELLGEVLALFDEDSRVIVVSDHGFVGHRRTNRGGNSLGVGMHRDQGILMLAGPGVKPGAELERAEVKDIMPTLLAMSGIPPARDLDGHLLGGAFEASMQSWFDEMISNAVESYDALRPRATGDGELSEEMNEEILEQLRSLGYIE